MSAGQSPLERRLTEEVLLLDGGLGSELIAQGLPLGQAPEGWVTEHPDRVREVYRRYVEAGSDIIHTVTFGGTPLKLQAAGLGGRCAEINVRAVALAKEAAGDRALVAGDVGPTGELFPPMGTATEEQLSESFAAQAEALVAAGVDLISIETMYDLREAVLAVRAARAAGAPVFASMTFDVKKRGFFTIVGDRVGPSLAALEEAGALAAGLNCSVTASQMLPMVQEAREAGARAIIAQPNAGQPRATADGVVYDADPETFARELVALVEAGARVVGGCCGTDPDFIRVARAALDARAG